MDRVKPLDDDNCNDSNKLSHTKANRQCDNFYCKECRRCYCSSCSKNQSHHKTVKKSNRSSSRKHSTARELLSKQTRYKTAAISADDAVTVSMYDNVTTSTKSEPNKSLNDPMLSKRRNLSFIIPIGNNDEITSVTTKPPPQEATSQSIIIHEYENIPPPKPKRTNLKLVTVHRAASPPVIEKPEKMKRKSKNKKIKNYNSYKIPVSVTTTTSTTTKLATNIIQGFCSTTDNKMDADSGAVGGEGTITNSQNGVYHYTNVDAINDLRAASKQRLSQGCTSLMYACLQGDNRIAVQELRTKPTDKLHRRDRKNKNVLHYCSSCQRTTDLVAAASVAVRAPELLESADEDGFTPLHLAVIQGNLAMVNLLLANKADVNAVDNEGHSVVHWATVCGEIEALRAVLQAGASVTKPDINGGSPLHYAAQMCGAHYEGKLNQATSSKLALEILTILLNHPQSSVDVADKDGRQPLLWAASAGSAKAVIALVKAGARVESSDKDGLTALHCAASRGHTECIDTLISLCGAPTDLIDLNGCTALHYAVTLGHADATSRLLDLEADPNRQDRKGRTPAHCGCAKGQLETVKLLKERGANLWLRNAKGDLPLHEASSSGRRELVEWLLDQRPKQVNTTSNDGRTMLHIAANNDYTNMCKMLIDFGADVNSIYRNSKGVAMTPLDCSLQKGFRSTAKFLQSNGGLPASKLRLSGRHPNAFNDQELVKPLKYAEKEELHDLKNQKKFVIYSKRSDSESSSCSCSEHWYKKEHHVNHVCKHHRKRLRRRTGSCGEVDEAGAGGGGHENCSEMCRSKSNIEIRRKRSRERVYSSDESDSCEVCCRHKRKLKSKRKEKCHQRRYKEITYSEEDDDAERMRSKRRIEREKGKYTKRSEIKASEQNIAIEQSETKQSKAENEKFERPQSAKNRRQQSKETTFIRSPPTEEASQVAGAMDNTDEDEMQKSEIVVTQVQVHKEGEDTPASSTIQLRVEEEANKSDQDANEIAIDDISKEVNNVIDNASEAVEKIVIAEASISVEGTEKVSEESHEKGGVGQIQPAEEPLIKEENLTVTTAEALPTSSSVEVPVEGAKNAVENPNESEETAKEETVNISKDENASNSNKENENTAEDADKLPDKLDESNASEEKPNAEQNEQKPTAEPSEKFDEKKEETFDEQAKIVEEQEKEALTEDIGGATEADSSVQKQVNADGKNEEKDAMKTQEKPEERVQQPKKKQSFSIIDDDNILRELNDNEKPTDKSVQIIVDEEPSDTLSPQMTPVVPQMSLQTPVERQQESRRSFTLLPDSPVAVSEVEHATHEDDTDEPVARKSSFQVLKSDESVENYDMRQEQLNEAEKEASFQIVSSAEKTKPAVERIAYSSEDADEVGDEEEDEQVEHIAGVLPGERTFNSGTRDGRHSAMAGSVSDLSNGRRKRLKRRVKSGGKGRGWRSVDAAEEESPNRQQASRDQDSGFEPSPRATKTKVTTTYNVYGSFVPKKTIYATIDGRTCSSRMEARKPGDKNTCNMTAVTKSIHRNIRRYYMERKIFQHLLELKSLQIRSSKLNEAVLVKRAVDDYHKSCIALGAETGGSLRRYPYSDYTFKNFEMFLYETLKSLQKPGTYNFQNINEVYEEAERRLSPDFNAYEKALQCTTKTHRCLHAAHAYTGIPCAAYIPMMNHHTMPKSGFGSYKKSGVGSFYLPKILTSPVKCGTSSKTSGGGGGGTRVSLELSHGKTKQLISLPSDKLDSNKRYYVTFTVKGSGEGTVTGSPGKTKIELSSDGKLVQQTDVIPLDK